MTELWDLIDETGRPLGRTHRRDDPAFPDGTFHLVVSVCAVRPDGRVLTTRRAAVKDWPLSWEFPAGSALAGETVFARTAAGEMAGPWVRRLRELGEPLRARIRS